MIETSIRFGSGWMKLKTLTAAEVKTILNSQNPSASQPSIHNPRITRKQMWDTLWSSVDNIPDDMPVHPIVAQAALNEFGDHDLVCTEELCYSNQPDDCHENGAQDNQTL